MWTGIKCESALRKDRFAFWPGSKVCILTWIKASTQSMHFFSFFFFFVKSPTACSSCTSCRVVFYQRYCTFVTIWVFWVIVTLCVFFFFFFFFLLLCTSVAAIMFLFVCFKLSNHPEGKHSYTAEILGVDLTLWECKIWSVEGVTVR